MPIYIISDKEERNMNELNQSLAENLSIFLFELRDEVIKGLKEYIKLNGGLSLETA